MSRAAQLDCQHERSCALVLTLFLFQKGQGFFPPLLIAALLPRSRRGANLPLAGGTLRYDLYIFASQKASVVSNPCWPFEASHEARRRMAVYAMQAAGSRTKLASREARRRAAVALRPSCMPPNSSAPKGRGVGSRGTAPCASHEARCRMAVFSIQLTGSHTEPASREACRRAAVALRLTSMSPEHPARHRRAVRG